MHKFRLLLSLLVILLSILTAIASATVIEGTSTYKDYLFILVHGINDSHKSWDGGYESDKNYKKYLEENLGLKGRVFVYSFSDPLQSVMKNARELGDRNFQNPAKGMNGLCWLEKARQDFINSHQPGTPVPPKYIVITHSLGNFAARCYIYSEYLSNRTVWKYEKYKETAGFSYGESKGYDCPDPLNLYHPKC